MGKKPCVKYTGAVLNAFPTTELSPTEIILSTTTIATQNHWAICSFDRYVGNIRFWPG